MKETLLLASDDEDSDEEVEVTLLEAFRRYRDETHEKWVREDNIIQERSPEEDEKRFEKVIHEREVKYQKRLADAQKKLEGEEKLEQL